MDWTDQFSDEPLINRQRRLAVLEEVRKAGGWGQQAYFETQRKVRWLHPTWATTTKHRELRGKEDGGMTAGRHAMKKSLTHPVAYKPRGGILPMMGMYDRMPTAEERADPNLWNNYLGCWAYYLRNRGKGETPVPVDFRLTYCRNFYEAHYKGCEMEFVRGQKGVFLETMKFYNKVSCADRYRIWGLGLRKGTKVKMDKVNKVW